MGYANSRKALNDRVDPEDKLVLTSRIFTLENMPNRGLIGINEYGLYSLAIISGLLSETGKLYLIGNIFTLSVVSLKS